jgi:hypothetical protein
MILESILILTILTAITILTANYLRSNEIVAGLVSGPWARLSGMIQNGVWMPPGKAEAYHPNHAGRHASLLGSDPQ